MSRAVDNSILLWFVLAGLSIASNAQTIAVGDLSYDAISAGVDQVNITNVIGNGFAVDASGNPISSSGFGIAVKSSTVDLQGGSSILFPGNDFTVVDGAGDVDCTASACNLSADHFTGAILTGTFTEKTGFSGLDPGYTSIESAYTTTIGSSSGRILSTGVDGTAIMAKEKGGVIGTPEPETWTLLCVGMVGLLLVARKQLYAISSAPSPAP